MFFLGPGIGFDEVTVMFRYGFQGADLPPEVALYVFLGFWTGAAELLDTGTGYRTARDDAGETVSLFFRGCSTSVPVPSSRPDRFGNRLLRLKWVDIGRSVVLEVFCRLGRGNARE